MEEYVEIRNNQFQLVKTGEYIRWHTDTAISVGGTIAQIGKTAKGYNWRVQGVGGLSITLYWDKHASIFVRKNVWYDMLEKRLNVLSSIVNFLIKETNLEEEFGEIKKNIQKAVALDDSIKTQKARAKRRTKSVPAVKRPGAKKK